MHDVFSFHLTLFHSQKTALIIENRSLKAVAPPETTRASLCKIFLAPAEPHKQIFHLRRRHELQRADPLPG